MLKWPFFNFIKPEETFVFEISETQVVTERKIKGYMHVGELISPPQAGPEPLFFPKSQ